MIVLRELLLSINYYAIFQASQEISKNNQFLYHNYIKTRSKAIF